MLQAVEVPAAKEAALTTPYLADSLQCPDMSVSVHSFYPQTEGTNKTPAGQTEHLCEQDVQNCSTVCRAGSIPAVTTSVGNTSEPPEAVAVPVTSQAAAAKSSSEAAATTTLSEATAATTAATAAAAITETAGTTAAAVTSTNTAAPAITTATATAATTVEAMAVSVVQAVIDPADDMNLLLTGQSTAGALHVPGYAQSSETDDREIDDLAVGIVAVVSNTSPVRLRIGLTDAAVTEAAGTAAAVTVAPTQPDIAMMPEERFSAQLAARAADSAEASTQASSCLTEASASSIASAAVPAQLVGTAVKSVNSVSQAGSVEAEGDGDVLGPGIVAEGESAPEAGIAEAEGIDSVPEASIVEAEGIDGVPEAGIVAAQEIESASEAGAEAEGIDNTLEAGSSKAVEIHSVPEARSAEAEGTDSIPESGSVKAVGMDSVPETGSATAEGTDHAPEAGNAAAEGIDHVCEAGNAEAEEIDSVPLAGSVDAQRSYSARASNDAAALTANIFADMAESGVKPDSGATDDSDMVTDPAASGATANPAVLAASLMHASAASTGTKRVTESFEMARAPADVVLIQLSDHHVSRSRLRVFCLCCRVRSCCNGADSSRVSHCSHRASSARVK